MSKAITKTSAIIITVVIIIALIAGIYIALQFSAPKTFTLYFFDPAPGNPWWDLVVDGVQKAVNDIQQSEGITVKYQRFDATSLDQQISQLQSALSTKPNAIVIGTVSDAVQDQLKSLRQAGVKVILVDRDVPDQTARDLYLGTNNRYAASMDAKSFLAYLSSQGISKPWKVIIFKGLPGIPTSYLRYQGFMDTLNPLVSKGDVVILQEVEVNPDDFSACYQTAQTIVARYGGQVTAFFATNNLQAMAIVKALQDAGYQPGKNVYICGFDAQPSDWLNMIKSGVVSFSVTQTPHLMGYWGVWAGYYLTTGKMKLPEKAVINTPIYAVLPCNATYVGQTIDYITVSPNELLTLANNLSSNNPTLQAPSYQSKVCG
jgi:ABC-type sugar transport system substrate-binding protein